jgi:3-hydroxypropanoate dehydrogenase
MSIPQSAIDQLFNNARTANGFLDKPVPLSLVQQIYDIAKMGSTSMNGQPARYVILQTPQAKERLLPALSPGNVDKSRSAPVVVIVATDNQFYENMPELFPNNPNAKGLFEGNAALAAGTATRNSTLSGAYFMIAARALGLDCGPMSGFDAAKVNAEFFPDGRYSVNFILNLGYGDNSKLFPRNPRLSFERACTVL